MSLLVSSLCVNIEGGGCLWCIHRGGARCVITCRVEIGFFGVVDTRT